MAKACSVVASVSTTIELLKEAVTQAVTSHSVDGQSVHVVIMSNGGFEGFHKQLCQHFTSAN